MRFRETMGGLFGISLAVLLTVSFEIPVWADPLSGAAPDETALPIDGEWIDFHGWCPDSRCYAYTIIRLQSSGRRQRRTEEYRFIGVPETGHARRRPSTGRRADLIATPLPRQREAEQTIRFLLPPKQRAGEEGAPQPTAPDGAATLVFRIVLNDVLGYALVLHRGGRSSAVGAGRYDDLYVDTEAHVFLSPDGEKLALVVYGQVPYRVKGEVHFMRMP